MQLRSLPAILEEIAALLEIEGENPFRAKAYHNAAKVVAGLDDLDSLIKEGRLKTVRGIGETLSANITEYRETGKMAFHEELLRKFPATLLELLQVPNLGPKKIKLLFEKLDVTSLVELEYACKENRLVSLFRFGERTQDSIIKGIEFLRRHKGEFLFGDVYPLAVRLRERLGSVVPGGLVEVCGSIRRKSEVVRNVDIVVGAAGADNAAVATHLAAFPEVEDVLAGYGGRIACRLATGVEARLTVVEPQSFPFAVLYFTGSAAHVSRLCELAETKGLILNERGFFQSGRPAGPPVAGEADIYACLGLAYVPPELREDRGELAAAASGGLPCLVEQADIKGTLHVHTIMSDGTAGLRAICDAARSLDLSYVGICDHSKSAYYAGGLKADDVVRQWEAIDEFNAATEGFTFFKGIESDILADGCLDYADAMLAGFDFVVASVHSGFSMGQAEMEARIVKAMENPYTTVLGHPTGRLLLARDGYRVDMSRIIDEAVRLHVMIELNASPYRLDIDWRRLPEARKKGVMVAINPDSHSASGLAEIFYGVGIARKGWLTAKDVANTRDAQGMRDLFAEVRHAKGH